MEETSTNNKLQFAVEEFWQVSTSFYEMPMVSEYLLELQNSQHKNVNELLFALWVSQSYHIELSSKNAEEIIWAAERTKKWAENIRNTRFELQQQWQPPYPEKIRSARDAMLETELEIEKLQQQKLVETLYSEMDQQAMQKTDNSESCMINNLVRCCGEPKNEADYLQLIMLWQSFIQAR